MAFPKTQPSFLTPPNSSSSPSLGLRLHYPAAGLVTLLPAQPALGSTPPIPWANRGGAQNPLALGPLQCSSTALGGGDPSSSRVQAPLCQREAPRDRGYYSPDTSHHKSCQGPLSWVIRVLTDTPSIFTSSSHHQPLAASKKHFWWFPEMDRCRASHFWFVSPNTLPWTGLVGLN